MVVFPVEKVNYSWKLSWYTSYFILLSVPWPQPCKKAKHYVIDCKECRLFNDRKLVMHNWVLKVVYRKSNHIKIPLDTLAYEKLGSN